MDKKWLNFIITNFITLLRVVGIFALIPVYKKYGGFTTFLLSSLCFLTDFIDGFLARNLNASTFFGSLFDALSDKAFLVINLLLLMSISPYAIILIIFELTIALIQSIKYNIGMNIKSNIFGKIKMWVAGLIISVWYLLTDYKVIHHFNINNLNNKTFLIIFIPLFISLECSCQTQCIRFGSRSSGVVCCNPHTAVAHFRIYSRIPGQTEQILSTHIKAQTG